MTKTITPPPGDEDGHPTVKAPPPPTVSGMKIRLQEERAALEDEIERLRAERDEARRVAEALYRVMPNDITLGDFAQIDPYLKSGQLPWEQEKGNPK